MDQFLQLSSQSQGTQPNSSWLIIKELASMQQENKRLSANLKEFKEQISCLINSLTECQMRKLNSQNGVKKQSQLTESWFLVAIKQLQKDNDDLRIYLEKLDKKCKKMEKQFYQLIEEKEELSQFKIDSDENMQN